MIDRSLGDLGAVLSLDAPAIVDRRRNERRKDGRAGGRRKADRRRLPPARLQLSGGRLVYAYRCPACGTHHEVSFRHAFARSYRVALEDERCLCPGREGLLVRHGWSRAHLMLWGLAVLWILNLVDFVLTRRALSQGIAREANRLMGIFLAWGWAPALAFKVGVVTLGAYILWRCRRHRFAFSATVTLVALYTVVVLYQLLLTAVVT